MGPVASIAIVAVLLGGVLPAIADFGDVWEAIVALTWLETVSLAGSATWNIVTYLLVIVAALPGLTLMQAFAVSQTSTAVTNTLPGGSAIGLGVTYAMFSSFGFGTGSIAIATVVTGLWNTFVKLGLPVVALALLTMQGNSNPALLSASLTGVAVLVLMIGALVLVLASERYARIVGEKAGAIVTRAAALLGREKELRWGDGFVRFRTQSIGLLRRRWHLITAATVVSHLSLFALLWLSLRHMGVAAESVTGFEALAAFSVVRLATVVPITPGSLGIVEVGLTTALVVAGGQQAPVVAAVLVYRALSYLLQLPLGLVGYVVWRSKKSWREPAGEATR
jgi:uncharacterized membrane protein YbhN (UPF0104 family)